MTDTLYHTIYMLLSIIVQRFVNPTTGLFQYFIKIVPTSYTSNTIGASEPMYTNQYVYSEKFRELQLPDPNDRMGFMVCYISTRSDYYRCYFVYIIGLIRIYV
jgi:hypothetical protein